MLFKSSKDAMIERIKGTILKKYSNFLVLDVNGIGLKINMSINSLESIPAIGKETKFTPSQCQRRFIRPLALSTLLKNLLCWCL